MAKSSALLVVETRIDIRTLAALFQYYASVGMTPRTRSELVRYAVEDCLTAHKLKPVTSAAFAHHVLSAIGLGPVGRGVTQAIEDGRLEEALDAFSDEGWKGEEDAPDWSRADQE
jgi:hypothetical protein